MCVCVRKRVRDCPKSVSAKIEDQELEEESKSQMRVCVKEREYLNFVLICQGEVEGQGLDGVVHILSALCLPYLHISMLYYMSEKQ